MAITQLKPKVTGAEEREATYEKRTGRFLIFFKTEWWEKVLETHIGNDIYIESDRPIRNVFLNGVKLESPHSTHNEVKVGE